MNLVNACSTFAPGAIAQRRPIAASVALLFLWALAALLPIGSSAEAGQQVLHDGVPHVVNEGEPSGGHETIVPVELWRAGGEDEEVLLGAPSKAIADAEGNVYVLDSQLNQVLVFGPEGEFLRTLSREGDGPGEIQNGADLIFMPDGQLGVLQAFPGKIVRFDRDDIPGSLFSPGGKPTAGGLGNLQDGAYRGGNLVLCGSEISQRDEGFLMTQYLASFAPEGEELARYLAKSHQPDFSKPTYYEKERYFVNQGRWALGPDGSVYTADQRADYAIKVFDQAGDLQRVVERADYRPRKRSQADRDEIGEGMIMIANGRRLEIDMRIEDDSPCISGMRVTDDGSLWVISSHGENEQPEGVILTYDVFDPEGNYQRQVSLRCEGDGRDDGLFWLTDDTLLVVRGMNDAVRSTFGGSGNDAENADTAEDDEEPTLLELICYRLPG